MAWTASIVGSSPRVLKFKLESDGVATDGIISNELLREAIEGRGPSPFREILSTSYPNKEAVEAVLDSFELGLRISPSMAAGSHPRGWGVEIDTDKGGLPTILVAHDGAAAASLYCYVYFEAQHTIIG